MKEVTIRVRAGVGAAGIRAADGRFQLRWTDDVRKRDAGARSLWPVVHRLVNYGDAQEVDRGAAEDGCGAVGRAGANFGRRG